jgi:cell fate (sporulation/competence/biofilm development) regulator YlbF (YheA/YmcA/DUF963 family)
MEKLNGNLIVEKARSFAKILRSSREFQEFHSVQEKLKQNKEAQSILEQFQRKQREVQHGVYHASYVASFCPKSCSGRYV